VPEAGLGDAEQVRAWATVASPVAVALNLAELIEEPHPEPGSCLRHARLGSFSVWEGDCELPSGVAWSGWARFRRSPGHLRVRYHQFGTLRPASDCEGGFVGELLDGRVHVWEAEGESHFELAVVRRELGLDAACQRQTQHFAIDYRGRTSVPLLASEDDNESSASTWSGAGTLAVLGQGKVEVRTTNERIDRARCKSEPLSGTTQLRTGEHTAVIRFDGERDCDPEATATWTLDGEPMGELHGLRCSVGDDERPAWPGVLVVFVVLARGARRRAHPEAEPPAQHNANAAPCGSSHTAMRSPSSARVAVSTTLPPRARTRASATSRSATRR
jgi:hypothetical protein